MSIRKRGKLFTSFVRTDEEKKLIKLEKEMSDTKRELEALKELFLSAKASEESVEE